MYTSFDHIVHLLGLDGENRLMENVMIKPSSFSLEVIMLYILLHRFLSLKTFYLVF